jgi:hypothetical protein
MLQPPDAVGLERFKDQAAGEPARDSGLDYGARLEMTGHAPGCAREPWLGVVPSTVSATTNLEPVAFKRSNRLGPRGAYALTASGERRACRNSSHSIQQ